MSGQHFSLDEVLKNFSEKQKDILIVRLLIKLKEKELAICCDSMKIVDDTLGKQIIEMLSKKSKNRLKELEALAPEIPKELKNELLDLAGKLFEDGSKGFITLDDQGELEDPSSERFKKKFLSEENFDLEDIERKTKEELDFLRLSLRNKGFGIKLQEELKGYISSTKSLNVINNLLEKEKYDHDLLNYNYTRLLNSGRWAGFFEDE